MASGFSITDSTLDVADDTSLGSTASTLSLYSTTVSLTAPLTVVEPITIADLGATIAIGSNSDTLAGPVSGPSTLFEIGTGGTLTLTVDKYPGRRRERGQRYRVRARRRRAG